MPAVHRPVYRPISAIVLLAGLALLLGCAGGGATDSDGVTSRAPVRLRAFAPAPASPAARR
jgi:hypothetical protein